MPQKISRRINLCDERGGFRVMGEGGIALKIGGGVTEDERKEIHAAVEEAIKKLGYDTDWIPIL